MGTDRETVEIDRVEVWDEWHDTLVRAEANLKESIVRTLTIVFERKLGLSDDLRMMLEPQVDAWGRVYATRQNIETELRDIDNVRQIGESA